MLTLVCPAGASDYPISFGTVNYPPYREDHTDPASRWLVDVPPGVAEHLIGVGGFTLARKSSAAAERALSVRMFHPDHGDTDAYSVDEEGFFLVPNGPEVAVMRAHGFLMEGEEVPKAPPPPVIPMDDHRKAVERIGQLDSDIREYRRAAQDQGNRLDVALAENERLKAELAVPDKKLETAQAEIRRLQAELDEATKPAK